MSLLLGCSPKASDSRLDPSANFIDESAPDWGQFHDHDQQQPSSSAVDLPPSTTSRREAAPSPGRSPANAAFGFLPDLGRSPEGGEATQRGSRTASPGWQQAPEGETRGQQLNMPFHFLNVNKDFLT